MILIQQLGYNLKVLIFLFLAAALTSCKSSSLFTGSSNTHIECYYKNDKLQFSSKLAGDHVIVDNWTELRSLANKNNLKGYRRYLIEGFYTRTSPYYDVFLLYFPTKSTMDYFFKKNNLPIRKDDSTFVVLDDENIIYSVLRSNDSYTVMLTKAHKNNHETANLMKSEYSEVFKNNEFGENYRKNIPSPFFIGYSTYKTSEHRNYYKPIETLYRFKDYYGNDFTYIQAICTFSSMIENHEVYKKYINLYDDYITQDTLRNGIVDFEALEEVVNIGKKSKLLMFNENHFKPEHRVLLRLLLKSFYKEGFRYLALESLLEEDSILNRRGYPTSNSGFYIAEPNMASLIRDALVIGFKLIGYEDNNPNSEKREINQAKNLYNKTFAQDSSSKVIVLAGHNHVYEEMNKNKVWMAAHFNNLYGINPVTFSQTGVKGKQNSWLEVVKNINTSRQPVDYLIYNNINSSIGVGATKITLSETTFSLGLPYELLKANRKYLLSIYLSDEYEDNKNAIPIKNVLINGMQKEQSLNLPKGGYQYVIFDINRGVMANGEFINE